MEKRTRICQASGDGRTTNGSFFGFVEWLGSAVLFLSVLSCNVSSSAKKVGFAAVLRGILNKRIEKANEQAKEWVPKNGGGN
jgi:hypothetical protein